jgi:putative ABC transport system permease protein
MIASRLRLAAEALATVRANPLRTSLAMLAVAAAVATVAVTATALQGIERSARLTSVRAFGSETFVIARVFPGQAGRRELENKLARNPEITRSDARFLDRHAGAAVLYAPLAQRPADVVAGGRRFENAAVNGTSAALERLRDLSVARGRFLLPSDDARGAQVVVLGADVADTLFPGIDPLGGVVRIGGRGFTVVGLQARQGTAGGMSLDRYAWIPVTTFERVFGAAAGLQIFARGAEGTAYVEAEDRARVALRARRHLSPGEADTFDLLSPQAARSFVARLSERISAAAVPISVMALLAAAVVVINTMLVSVAQRTREIGVRRAIGGARRDVMLEVLAESTMIAVAGGLVGTALAAALLRLGAALTGIPLPLEPTTAAVSIGAAGLSGVAAGWYPARRAASIDVIAALRHE